MNVQDLLLSTDGRLGRRDFACAAVALAVVGGVASLVPVIGPVVGLAALWSWRALAAKRLHDMGRDHRLATVLMLANIFIGAGGLLLSLGAGTGALGIVLLPILGMFALIATIAMCASLGFLLWLALTPGEAAANRFGAPAAPLDLQALLG